MNHFPAKCANFQDPFFFPDPDTDPASIPSVFQRQFSNRIKQEYGETKVKQWEILNALIYLNKDEIFFWVILALFEALKPNSQETAQNFENVFYKRVLELLFTPICQCTPSTIISVP
jgi:hypothetical protein